MLNLNRVIAGSLRGRLGITAFAFLVCLYGGYVAATLPIDVLPDLNRPTVTILTEAHGMVPEDVERLVTRPIEQAVGGATGVSRVRSGSGLGLSVVFVEFGWETEIFRARQIVQEKLGAAGGNLPPGTEPLMAPISSVMGQILLVGFTSRGGVTGPEALRDLVDRQIRSRLLSLQGVAQVVAIGGSPRQLQVTADARAMRAYDVTLEDVAAAVRAANTSGSGGVLPLGAEGPLVRVPGFVSSARDIEEAVVRAAEGRPVRVGDVARVEFGPAAIRAGEAGVNGSPGVILTIFKQPGVDTVELTARLRRELDDVASALPPDVEIHPDVYEQGAFIQRAIDNVTAAVRDGGLLVVVVLFLFLLTFRTTFITLTAIPLSIAITAIIFRIAGVSINTMTLGGLAVAIGALVDDAIVNVENVFRRLRENRALAAPLHPLIVIYRASSEVRKPIFLSTLIVVVVYAPLFALTGMEGRLFTPVGIAYIVSILASLLISLTLTPVLCWYLLPRAKITGRGDGWLVRKVKVAGGALMDLSCRHPWKIAGAVGLLAALSLLLVSTRGTEFLPPFNEGTAQINLILPPGVSLETSDAFGRRLEEVVGGVAGVKSFGRRTGRGEGDEHAEGVGMSEVIVTFDPRSGRTREEVIDEIRDRVAAAFPGVPSSVEQPLAHLLSHILSGVNAQVALKIFGPDLELLRGLAAEAEALCRGVPGVKDLIVEPQVLVREVTAKPRRDALARRGLSVESVASVVELGLEGAEISRMIVGQAVYPIILRLRPEDRSDLRSLENLTLEEPGGGHVLLSEVADIGPTWTPNNVNRENGSRRIVVQLNVSGRSLSECVADVESALAPLRARLASLPGYTLRLSGQFEAQQEAERRLLLLSLLSLAIMFLLLFGHYRSMALTLQVMAKVPMALIGGVAAVLFTGQTVSVAVIIGFVSLAGIAARNSVLLLDHYLHVMREEKMSLGQEMVLKAGKERLIPVLMTALCTGVGLLPIALSPGEPGRELLYPVATVILGGLVTSTLLDVLLTPGLFLALSGRLTLAAVLRPEPRDAVSEESLEEEAHRA